MKLRKVLCLVAVSAAVAMTGSLAANAPVLVQAEEEQNTAELDGILRQLYAFYEISDYTSVYAYGSDSYEVLRRCADQIVESGADRYICDIDGNEKVMLYVGSDGYFRLYFGTTENDLRDGYGTTMMFWSECYEVYTGYYDADFPAGDGVEEMHWKDGDGFSISGNFQGLYLNGTYQVDYTCNGQPSSISIPYANNHIQAFDSSIEGPDIDSDTIVVYEGIDLINVTFWNSYGEWDASGWDLSDTIRPGYELLAFGIYNDGVDAWRIQYYAMPTDSLNEGFNVLYGNSAGINFTGTFVSEEAPATPETEEPAEPTEPETTDTTDVPETDITTPEPTATPDTYVVQRNDNLSKIAQKIYGDRKYWRAIYEANSDVIKSDYTIWANQVLVIPSI